MISEVLWDFCETGSQDFFNNGKIAEHGGKQNFISGKKLWQVEKNVSCNHEWKGSPLKEVYKFHINLQVLHISGGMC